MVAHVFNRSTWEGEVGRSLSLSLAWPTKQVSGQHGLGREMLSWETKTQTNKKNSVETMITFLSGFLFCFCFYSGGLLFSLVCSFDDQTWGLVCASQMLYDHTIAGRCSSVIVNKIWGVRNYTSARFGGTFFSTALGKQRQEELSEFKVILVCTSHSRISGATRWDLCLKKTKKQRDW